MAKGFSRPAGAASGGMMQQIQRLQQQLAEAQAQLAQETVTASSGGGAVKVTITGDQKCQSVEISPGLLEDFEGLSSRLFILEGCYDQLNRYFTHVYTPYIEYERS